MSQIKIALIAAVAVAAFAGSASAQMVRYYGTPKAGQYIDTNAANVGQNQRATTANPAPVEPQGYMRKGGIDSRGI